MIKVLFNKLKNDSLYSNSIFLLLSSAVLMGLGFIFWTIVARLFTSEQIGAANTVYSLITTVSGLSLLGITSGLIRFLPTSRFPLEKINTSITFAIISTVIGGIITLLLIPVLPPNFNFLSDPYFKNTFLIFCLIISLNSILESILLVYRKTKNILIKNTLFGLVKLLLPLILVFYGAFGIVFAIILGVATSLTYSFFILFVNKKIKFNLSLHTKSLKIMGSYSLGTYIASLSANLHSYFLPLFITGTQNVKSTAYFTIASTIASIIFIIPQVVSQSLLVEGAHQEKQIFAFAKKSLLLVMTVMVPVILGLILFGQYFLAIFGKEYSDEGINFLRIYSLSGLFVGANYIFGTILYIQKRLNLVMFLSLINSILIIVLSILFNNLGLIGIGLAALYAQIALTLMYILSFRLWKHTKQLFKPVFWIN